MSVILLICTHTLAALVGAGTVYWVMVRFVCARVVDGHIVLELNPDHPHLPLHRTDSTGDDVKKHDEAGEAQLPGRGERGPHGDHGQQGEAGETGGRGGRGLTGERGATGKQGADGSSSRNLWMVSLTVLAASLIVIGIGWQGYQIAADNRERDREDRAYANCLSGFAEDLVNTIETRSDATSELTQAQARKDRALDQLLEVVLQAQGSGDEESPPALRREFREILQERVDAQNRYDALEKQVRATRADNPYVSPKVVCQR